MAKKNLLPSDQLTFEDYVKEDLSRMRNLVADYEQSRTPGRVIYNYNTRLDELIGEIIRDPRNYAELPNFLLNRDTYYSTVEEHRYFWTRLNEQVDPIDMRNKLERIMDKPYNRMTPSELKAFHFFAKVKKLNDLDTYASAYPEVYFKVYDKVYRGHKQIKDMDAEREKFGDQLPVGFEKSYQRRLADIVIEAPQIYWELPPEIKDNMNPPNYFYERMTERIDVLERMREEVAQMRAQGKEVTQEEHFKEGLLAPVEDYVKQVERYAEEQLEERLAKLEQGLEDPMADVPDFEYVPVDDDYLMGISPEEMEHLARQTNYGVTQEELDAYYSMIPDDAYVPSDEDYEIQDSLYFAPAMEEDVPEYIFPTLDDEYNFSSIEQAAGIDFNEDANLGDFSNYIFTPERMAGIDNNWIEVDDFDDSHGGDYIFGNNDELQSLGDEWYLLNSKDHLSRREVERMVEIESDMGEMVSDDQSLYITVPSEIADPTRANNPFFESMLTNIEENELDVDPIIESDLSQYRLISGRPSIQRSEREPSLSNDSVSMNYEEER